MEDNGTYSWTPNQPEKPKKKLPDFKRATKSILVVMLTLVLLALIGTCFYTVDDKQRC